MAPQVEFHGSESERLDLLACLARNCECVYAPVTNLRTTCCPGHSALVNDQYWLNHMEFGRTLAVCRARRAFLQGVSV